MTVYTLGANETKEGPFAETHAFNQLDARRKVQSADYCVPIGPTATRYITADEVRIYEKFEDLPPV
jgi:hypothetical protein